MLNGDENEETETTNSNEFYTSDESSEQSNYSSSEEDSDGELIISTGDDLPLVDEVCLFLSPNTIP